MRRVVVTGIGMCSPLGYGADYCWKRLIESESGIDKLTGFEIEDLACKVGGQIPLDGRSDLFIENVIDNKDRRKTEIFIQYAISAAKEAIELFVSPKISIASGFILSKSGSSFIKIFPIVFRALELLSADSR